MTPACMSSTTLSVEARDSGCMGAEAEFVLLRRQELLLSHVQELAALF